MRPANMINKILVTGFALISTTCFAQGPFNIGTIHPGDSIIIYYDVQINNPLVPPGTTQISNQGTVSGSNFSNQVTNDPDTGPANDPTITLLNVFPLPITFTEFRAYQKGDDIELAWKVSETDIDKYEVERSADGRTFVKIGEVIATGGNGLLSYNFLDANPFTGNNFYRLKVIERVAPSKFTNVVRVSINSSGPVMNMYPNPVPEKMLNLEMKKLARGTYQFDLYNNMGQRVFTKQVEHAGGSASVVVLLPANLRKGIYHAQVTGENVVLNKKLLID